LSDNLTSGFAAAGVEVDDPIRAFDDVQTLGVRLELNYDKCNWPILNIKSHLSEDSSEGKFFVDKAH
jgi:hypothetical protein